MILTDTGPLIALIDQGEPDHQACVACLPNLSGPMITTWPVFTEAMYLLGEAGGWRAQEALWGMLQKGDLEIVLQGSDHYRRMRALMEKYCDHPMDLADASLVCLAEERRLREIFTLDEGDFRTYRVHGRQTFRLWPGKAT
ncbi:MAG: PIN domain-containing protein [Deltaproteobacteria bacterium]|nr:PIN domain-containing protein [Deltaproteobacteria bacterium]